MDKKILASLLVALVVIVGAVYLGKINKPKAVDPNAIVLSNTNEKTGTYLTDTRGRTLYVNSDDRELESMCEGGCLAEWQVFEFDNKNLKLAPDNLSKKINILKRSDGMYQYAYGGQPLYYYNGDKSKGEVSGNGTNGKWTVVLLSQ